MPSSPLTYQVAYLLLTNVTGYVQYHYSTESEVGLDREGELVNENLLECRNIVLLIEDKHSLLVVHGINRTEGYRAVLVRDQDCVAGNAGRTLVSIGECLDVG